MMAARQHTVRAVHVALNSAAVESADGVVVRTDLARCSLVISDEHRAEDLRQRWLVHLVIGDQVER